MAKSKPWLEYGNDIPIPAPIKQLKPKKSLLDAYVVLLVGHIFGCHRRYLGQYKQANRILSIFWLHVFAAIMIVFCDIFLFHVRDGVIMITSISLTCILYLILIREIFILPKLVRETNRRIDIYNAFWCQK